MSVTAILLLTWLFSNAYEALLERELSQRIAAAATTTGELLADRWPAAPTESTQEMVRQLGQEIGVRLTLVAADGAVLADSQLSDMAKVEQTENHADRT